VPCPAYGHQPASATTTSRREIEAEADWWPYMGKATLKEDQGGRMLSNTHPAPEKSWAQKIKPKTT